MPNPGWLTTPKRKLSNLFQCYTITFGLLLCNRRSTQDTQVSESFKNILLKFIKLLSTFQETFFPTKTFSKTNSRFRLPMQNAARIYPMLPINCNATQVSTVFLVPMSISSLRCLWLWISRICYNYKTALKFALISTEFNF